MNLECWSVLEDRQTSVPITRTRLLNNVLVQSCYGNNVQFRLLDKIRRYITDWYWAVDEGSMSCRHNSDQTRYTPPQSGTVHETQHHQLLDLWRQEQKNTLEFYSCLQTVNTFQSLVFFWILDDYLFYNRIVEIYLFTQRQQNFTFFTLNWFYWTKRHLILSVFAGPGGPIQDANGYTYCYNYTMKNGDKTWRCSKRKNSECKAYIITENGWIKALRNYHTH